jgi:hypothetical protein
MRYLFLAIFFCAFCNNNASASTSITTPTVSGHWLASGSPYLVYNNIRIDSATTLVIDPGVTVIFQGAYGLDVAGMLCAKGTAANPINFRVQDTTGWKYDTTSLGGWHGIHFLQYSSPLTDTSAFEYCNVSDMKALFYARTLVHFYCFRKIALRNCNFFHNKSLGSGACVYISTNPPGWWGYPFPVEISNCKFYNNIGNYNGWDSTVVPAQQYPGNVLQIYGCSPVLMSGNSFHDNIADAVLTLSLDTAVVVNNSFYNNTQVDDYILSTGAVGQINLSAMVVFKNNKVYKNWSLHTALLNVSYASVDINANLICNNYCMYGGGHCPLGSGGCGIRFFCEDRWDSVVYHNFVRNNVIANNFSGAYGSAIYDYGVNLKVVNNTIVNNSGGSSSIFFQYLPDQAPRMMIKNNIMYGNDGKLALANYAPLEISHNLFYGPLSTVVDHPVANYYHLASDTTNIITGGPQLVAPTLTNSYTEDALLANFDLQSTSPCIHAGDTTNAYIDTTDYAGYSRLTGGRLDIGAYQYHLKPANVTNVTTAESVSIYPNPATNFVIIKTPRAIGTIEIMDMTGKTIAKKIVTDQLNLIDLKHATPGMYMMQWREGERIVSTEMIVVE